MAFFEGQDGMQVRRAVVVVLWLLVAFLGVEVVSGLQSMRYIGAGITAANTISVSGRGEIFATPDLATFTYSVVSDKATVAAAQADATAKSNAITDYLKSAGVSANDIQTSGYSVYPQYEYQNAACPQPASPGQGAVAPAPVNSVSSGSTIYCPPGKQVLIGYEASQTTTVKARDLTKAGDLLAGVGTKGASNISGLQFTFDDPNAPQNQARDKAIADAKSKADTLAKSLGVTLVRVVSFNESSGGIVPRVYSMAASTGASAAPSPEISPGQNTITDDVTITYEIR
ncbi:MAG: SIMPL domain-containing protein [Patescibacteria group bacterium]|nr:SIMPL domain-containing protein [Patescibacteria group bacterium]